MTQVFKLPDLGEGLPDAEIVEWMVAVGDAVSRSTHGIHGNGQGSGRGAIPC